MFTVKFISNYSDGSSSQVSISCPHYEIYKHSNQQYSVICYKDMTCIDGVSRMLMSDKFAENSFGKEEATPSYCHCAFIENQAGKTIDRVTPE